MMNQRTIRTGRLRCLSPTGWPEIWLSVWIFMSCTFCSYRLSRIRRQLAVQMRSNCGFVKSNAAKNELAKLPLEVGGIAVSQARHGRQLRQRRHQHGVMGKPKQIERLASDLRS